MKAKKAKLNYNHNNKCIDCNTLITNNAKRCSICSSLNISKSPKRNKLISEYIKLNNPNYKDGRSKKLHTCKECGKQICYQTGLFGNGRCKSCARKASKKHYFCIDCSKEINRGHKRCKSCAVKGVLSGLWQGGISKLPYAFEFTKELKDSIRKRDGYKCCRCHISEKKYFRKLDIHHIDYNKQNCKENNLITLCVSCNSKVNSNRDYWFAYFTYLMGVIYGTKI